MDTATPSRWGVAVHINKQRKKENKMGAHDMTDSAIVSKDDGINVAYQSAVKQANWDHGHDSYN